MNCQRLLICSKIPLQNYNCHWHPYLTKYIDIYRHYASDFCTGHTGQLNRKLVGVNASASCRCFMEAPFSAIGRSSQRRAMVLLYKMRLWGTDGGKERFYIAFPAIITFNLQVRKLMCGFCGLLSNLFVLLFGTQKITTGLVSSPVGLYDSEILPFPLTSQNLIPLKYLSSSSLVQGQQPLGSI